LAKSKDGIYINKRKHPISHTYFCKECSFVFTIHTQIKSVKKKLSCPYCSDFIAVEPYKEPPKKSYRPWTEEEFRLIDRIVAGELQKYQVAAMVQRTYGSVQRKTEVRKRELGLS
jgi:DNA-directed RNA polymerase subunit RPC12/RpoP